MILTKADASTNNDKVKNLTREFNIHYRACISSLVYLFSKRVHLSFAVQKLAIFSSNSGKVHFKGLIYLLRYIRNNKTLGLNYYFAMEDVTLSDMLRQYSIKTENQFMAFSNSS